MITLADTLMLMLGRIGGKEGCGVYRVLGLG